MTHVPQDAYLKHELVAMLQSCMVLSSAEIHIAALKPLLKARIDYVMQRQIVTLSLVAQKRLLTMEFSMLPTSMRGRT